MNIQTTRIAIIGLGYVGLPLAVEFGKKYPTIGFDINSSRVKELNQGLDSTLEVESAELTQVLQGGNFSVSDDVNDIANCNIYIVTVPTPIDESKRPDLRPLISASTMLGKILKKGDIVIYESTTYPGCTEEDCVPVLEKHSSLVFNRDFYCGYSPERINPGDKINTLTKIRKVTAGSTPEVAEFVDQLYASIITAGTYKATSIRVAEASKAIENAQRDVNISFVNELALIFDSIGIDTHEVLEAAATKWNFLNYKPGLVGGHCIGVDPYYLAHKAETVGYHPAVILSGRRVNDNMGKYVANKTIKLMIEKGLVIRDATVLILGITFKENCPDVRNTRVVDIVKELESFHINPVIFDPWANPEEVMHEYNMKVVNQLPDENYQAAILAVAHDEFKSLDLRKLVNDGVIYDVKGVLPKAIVDARL